MNIHHSIRSVGLFASLLAAIVAGGCGASHTTFEQDLAFLQTHVETIVLGDDAQGPLVAVVPAYQGRVMTSTAGGVKGPSYGWLNRELIASGERRPHINAFGGEDRFWLGPEGGQFAIFFEPGSEFTLEDWQTPPLIDTEPFDVRDVSRDSVSFQRHGSITSFSGTTFDVRIDRTVRLLDRADVARLLSLDAGQSRVVAYESENHLTNAGENHWTRDSGLLSIWILGMFNPSPSTTIVIPFRQGSEAALGPVVNDDYFGPVPADRLAVGDGVVYFKGDGRMRGKIGLSPKRSTPIAGAWDPASGVLTIVQYNQPGPEVTDYVNSSWAIQEAPYGGDVINSYNDGPPEPGATPLGPFYELETSSPAAALAPGQSIKHTHRTFHFEGPRDELDRIARAVLHTSLDEIEKALP